MSIETSLSPPQTAARILPIRRPKSWFPYIVLTPMIVWFLVFVLYPVVYSLWTSLHLWIVEDPSKSVFVGLQNYIDLFTTDRRFPTALRNTLAYGFAVTAFCVPVGFLAAAALSRVKSLNQIYIFTFFLPSLVPASVIGVVFGFFYQPTFGTANFLLQSMGLKPLIFLKDPNLAIWTIATVEIWQRIGFVVLICYSGLMELPQALLEAARIDGANSRQILTRIILPLMTRVLLFVTVVTLIAALQAFDLIYVMTLTGTGSSIGGPGISTYTLALLVFNEGLTRFRFGTAGATASVLFIIIFIATILQFRFFRTRWENE